MKHTNHVIESKRLGKGMAVRVYGTKGYPVIAFPTQDQMADEWESNGMLDVFEPYLDAGRIQLFTVDSNDLESWSSTSDDYAARIARQEDYYDFVCDELVPFVHRANGSMYRPELMGCSLGATQATIEALRRPDLFQGAVALSGMYHTSYFFGNWGNDVSYANDVNAFLPNTPADHPYLELYRHRTFAFSIGQAADEQFGVSDLHFLQDTFQRLGIDGWFDFWGPECNHDWYWWKQQMAKFLPEAVKELEGVAAAEPELAKAPVAVKAAKPAKAKVAGKVSKDEGQAATKRDAAPVATKKAVHEDATAAKSDSEPKQANKGEAMTDVPSKKPASKPIKKTAAATKTSAATKTAPAKVTDHATRATRKPQPERRVATAKLASKAAKVATATTKPETHVTTAAHATTKATAKKAEQKTPAAKKATEAASTRTTKAKGSSSRKSTTRAASRTTSARRSGAKTSGAKTGKKSAK